MKRFFFLIIPLIFSTGIDLRAQDAATEERLNKLSGQIEDLLAAKVEQDKRIAALAKELENVREQAGRPNASYASQEDLKRLAEKLQEIDKNREHDKELILKEIGKLGKAVTVPAPPIKKSPATTPSEPGPEKSATPDKGYEYTVKSGDTLSSILQAYREQNIKVSLDQVLKANPGLKPEKLRVGQKIFIPAPQP